MDRGPHDGGEPRGFSVAGLEVTLQISEEDANAGREAQGEGLGHQGG